MDALVFAKQILNQPCPLWLPLITAALYVLLSVIAILYGGQHADAMTTLLQVGFVIPLFGIFMWSHRNETNAVATKLWVPPAFISVGVFLVFALCTTLRMHQGDIYDESAYLFQAKTIASGRLTAEAPPIHKSMVTDYPRTFRFQGHVMHDGKWFGKYPPGWPLILAAGLSTGLAPIINPALALCLLWLTNRIGCEVFGRAEGRLAVAIVAMSPFFVYNSAGFLSHPSCAVAILGATFCFLRADSQHASFWYPAAFILIACGFLIRPYTAVWSGVVLVVSLFARLRPLKAITVLACGSAILAAAVGVYLLYNERTTGDAMLTGYALYNIQNPDKTVELNFSPDSLWKNLTTITRWSVQEMVVYSFPLVWVTAVVAMMFEWRLRPGVLLLAGMGAIPIFAHVAMADSSHSFFGERYYYEAYVPLCVLSARGFQLLGQSLHVAARTMHRFLMALAVLIIFPFLRLTIVAASWPQRYSAMERETSSLHDVVVYMAASPKFVPEDLNTNRPDWRDASLFYLPDPGVERRAVIAASLEKSSWVVVCYDARVNSARICERGQASR
jgi:hypothetical protein